MRPHGQTKLGRGVTLNGWKKWMRTKSRGTSSAQWRPGDSVSVRARETRLGRILPKAFSKACAPLRGPCLPWEW